MNTGFEAISIAKPLVRQLQQREIMDPTPIQAEAIPPILEGKDVIARSQTGTGKTLAYLLPLMQKIDASAKTTQVLVLVPTRELGMQIVREAEWLSADSVIRVLPLIGGAALSRQADKLRLRPQLTVGTPGRVLELIKMKKLSMHHIRTIVIDEVDQVLALGSASELETIIKSALRDRQLLFFSATLSAETESLGEKWMRDPVRIEVNPSQRTAENLEHYYFVSERRDKVDMVRKIVRLYNPKSAIVFINEIDPIAEVVAKLRHVGLSVEALYGEASKQERAKVMKGFRDGKFQLLLATGIAARGLDIPEMTHVINLDLPPNADHYIHRAGRTGRMGRAGTVLSIVTPQEQQVVEKLSRSLGIEIRHQEMYAGQVVEPAAKPRGAALSGRKATDTAAAIAAPKRKPARPSEGKPVILQGKPARPIEGKPVIPQREQAALSPRPATPAQSSQPAQGGAKSKTERNKQRDRERGRDRKNKGAPRWLKEKPQRTDK